MADIELNPAISSSDMLELIALRAEKARLQEARIAALEIAVVRLDKVERELADLFDWLKQSCEFTYAEDGSIIDATLKVSEARPAPETKGKDKSKPSKGEDEAEPNKDASLQSAIAPKPARVRWI